VASSAGLNRVGARGGEVLLSLQPGSPAGDLDSGIQAPEGIGFSKWAFQMIGAGATAAGYTVTLYGTLDPAAYDDAFGRPYGGTGSRLLQVTAQGRGYTGLPATSWFPLPAPSEQSGTGVITNPMISGSASIMFCTMPLVAVRAKAVVATGGGAPTNPIQVLVFGVP
jgi:hypothetical protein